MEFVHQIQPEPHAPHPLESGLQIASPAFEQVGRLTFRNESRFDLAASVWRDATFLPTLVPALTATLDFARNGEVREIIALEAAVLSRTPTAIADALVAEGRRLAAVTGDPRGDRVLPRLHAAIRDGSLQGHFTILFAARCAVFSIATRTTLGAYLLQEFLAGSPRVSASKALAFAGNTLDDLDLTSPRLRAA